MTLRVASTASLIISQDNAAIPQEATFNSGLKSFIDTSTYNYSTSDTYKVVAGATNVQINLGSLAEVDALFLLAKGTGLTVKLVPPGGSQSATLALALTANFPTIIGAAIGSLFVSNPGITDIALVFGAAGN